MNKPIIELWVGILVLAGVTALLFLALRTSDASMVLSRGGGTYKLTAVFDNIGSLKKDAPVRSSGVIVGRVTNIGFDSKKYEAVVEMAIDNRYHFPDDTYAKIRTSGLLGEQFINFAVGGSEKDLQNGGVIVKTEPALALEDLVGQFMYSGKSGAPKP